MYPIGFAICAPSRPPLFPACFHGRPHSSRAWSDAISPPPPPQLRPPCGSAASTSPAGSTSTARPCSRRGAAAFLAASCFCAQRPPRASWPGWRRVTCRLGPARPPRAEGRSWAPRPCLAAATPATPAAATMTRRSCRRGRHHTKVCRRRLAEPPAITGDCWASPSLPRWARGSSKSLHNSVDVTLVTGRVPPPLRPVLLRCHGRRPPIHPPSGRYADPAAADGACGRAFCLHNKAACISILLIAPSSGGFGALFFLLLVPLLALPIRLPLLGARRCCLAASAAASGVVSSL